MNLREKTKQIIKDENLFIKKRYGQNFLVDYKIIKELGELVDNNNIIEIGPGLGSLTRELVKKNNVLAIEIDKTLCEILDKEFKNKKIKIINENVLKLNLKEISDKYFPNENIIFFSNLPYNITSKIIEKVILLENFEKAYFMVQKEWANKIIKKEKSSFIVFLINLMCKVKILKHIGKNSFFPSPMVDSIVLEITPKKEKKISISQKENIKKMFNKKRKKIKSLFNNINKEIEKTLINENIDINKRIQELSQEEIVVLERLLENKND